MISFALMHIQTLAILILQDMENQEEFSVQ